MKERPILFSGPMVRAILDGSKTQTRREIKPQPTDSDGEIYDGKLFGPELYEPAGYDKHGEMIPMSEIYGTYTEDGDWGVKCPYGKPGDQLWGRESYQNLSNFLHGKYLIYRADNPTYPDGSSVAGPWTPTIHMFCEHSRIHLEITDIRVERLLDISNEDALAEGVISYKVGNLTVFGVEGTMIEKLSPKAAYIALWDEINGRGASNANPWVWIVDFRRIN